MSLSKTGPFFLSMEDFVFVMYQEFVFIRDKEMGIYCDVVDRNSVVCSL